MPTQSIESILKWIAWSQQTQSTLVKKVPLSQMHNWALSDDGYRISHASGKFFSIEGISVYLNGTVWDQAIVRQPEYGILGMLVTEDAGEVFLLIQAKVEPGNVNWVQLSPTLQATQSNYNQVHKGRRPHYLDFFLHPYERYVLYDGLQSEQGSRFLKKRNRNMIVYIEDIENVPIMDNFLWVSFYNLKQLCAVDNLVNMDTRSVISCITPDIMYEIYSMRYRSVKISGKHKVRDTDKTSFFSDAAVLTKLTEAKVKTLLEFRHKPLSKLVDWDLDDNQLSHTKHKYFRVIGVRISVGSREVSQWDQPMLEPANQGLCALFVKYIDDVLHCVAQVISECGVFDTAEFGPSIQCLDEDYRNASDDRYPLLSYALDRPRSEVLYDVLFSEEGGRFFQDQNRYMVIKCKDNTCFHLPENYVWLSFDQVYRMILYSNVFNIQFRSLLSLIPFPTKCDPESSCS